MNVDADTANYGKGAMLKSIGLAFLALASSAVVLIFLYTQLSPELASHEQQASGNAQESMRFKGSQFTVQLGKGKHTEHGTLQFTAVDPTLDNRALATRDVTLQAGDLPFLEVTGSNLHSNQDIYFIWRRTGEPGEIHFIPLSIVGSATASYQLALHPDWRGSISDIGIDIYGDLGHTGPAFAEITLHPSSVVQKVQSVLTQWRAFTPWSYASINHQATNTVGFTPQPTLIAAALAGAAVLLLLVYSFAAKSRRVHTSMLIAVLLPWIGLDLLWQGKFSARVADAGSTFEGLSREQQHLAERDADLYRFAQKLKQEHLGQPGKRIFLINEKINGQHYRRLRAQFHLLPHNIYNFGDVPRPDKIRAGDYLLVIDALPSVSFDQNSGELHWGDGHSMPVMRVYADQTGQLYRYSGEVGPS